MIRLTPIVLIACLGLALPALSAEDGHSVINSTITEVAVYSDRAQVTRVGKVRLEDAPTVYSFKKLPGWVDDGSVRVAISPADAGDIHDVQVRRNFLALATDEGYRKAQTAVQEISDEIIALDDELAVLDAQAAQIEAMRVFSLDRLPKDAMVREVKVEEYRKVVEFVAGQLRALGKARRALEVKRRGLIPELSARQRRLGELQGMTQLEETSVLVTVSGRAGKQVKLKLTYMLPGATWEPVHELRTRQKELDSAEVSTFAVVTQTSGEDWVGAKLTFSTQSSTQSNQIPRISALKLGDSNSAARIMQERTDSFNRAKTAFEGQNRMWNKMNALAQGNQMDYYDANYDQLQMVQAKTVAVFERLGKRGTTALFPGEGKVTIRGDGHPVRVRIGKAKLAAKQAIVAVPEQSLNAVKTLKMENVGFGPLLPGTAALFQDGAFLGMTDFDFVAEGETFSAFLGVADQVKLSRVMDQKHSSIDRKKRTTMNVAFVLTVENLSDSPVTLDLADRIPISENKEIEVDKISISDDTKPNSKGLLKWHLTLAPKTKKIIHIKYRVEYPPALVQKMHKKRAAKQRAMPSAAVYDEYDASDQIMRLEESMH